MITKGPSQLRFQRQAVPFESARAGFRALIASVLRGTDDKVLLPAYIGWSPREGSGVFDPVRESGVRFDFYRMDRSLRIDLADFRQRINRGDVRIVVLIHYFGIPDPQYEAAVSIARQQGVYVLEDEAHAMFTDLVLGTSGRLGDAALFSLHKMLPVPAGGLLVLNSPLPAPIRGTPDRAGDPWQFDLTEIAKIRLRNAEALRERLSHLAPRITPLWQSDCDHGVPQSVPILVHDVSRDQLYHTMNQAGFGVVSLYHTMISELPAAEYPDAHWLAAHVMNLPVHQDVSFGDIEAMVSELERQLDRLSSTAGATNV